MIISIRKTNHKVNKFVHRFSDKLYVVVVVYFTGLTSNIRYTVG